MLSWANYGACCNICVKPCNFSFRSGEMHLTEHFVVVNGRNVSPYIIIKFYFCAIETMTGRQPLNNYGQGMEFRKALAKQHFTKLT